MEDTKTRIAHNLDAQFAKMGFTVPGVDVLHESADVSLRTLYKYYPSREAMVEGALQYRNEIYLDWISGEPKASHRHVLHIYERLGVWLVSEANNGCLFLNALAAYPDILAVRKATEHHKNCVQEEFARRLSNIAPNADIDGLSEALLAIHEGQTDTARLAALRMARALLTAEEIAA